MITVKKTLASIALLFAIASLSLSAGCSSKPAASASDMGVNGGAIANTAANFKDIELPVEMKWETNDSMSISTNSFQGGIIKYSGRVEMGSLKEFIIASMANNKWKLVGEAQYENALLAFTKPNKTCMMVLDETFGGFFGKTTVTMYVTNDLASGGKMNPFGEPAGK